MGCSLRDEFPDDLCRGAVAAHHVGYPGLRPSRMLCFPPDQQEMVVMLPPLFIALFLGRYIVRGLTLGALK